MEMLSNFGLGLSTAITPEALLFCLIGVTVGTFVGVLPGVGAMAAISLALPMTYHLDPTYALIMLAGIFYGSQYGGSTAAILLNLPGSVTNAVTCLDGYPMARNGKAGVALFVTAIASFIGSSFAIVIVMGFAPMIAEAALSFSSYEYFAVMLMGLIAASTLSSGSPAKGLAAVILGVLIGIIGTDVTSGQYRYTFGLQGLSDGVNLIAIAMGLFGISEILSNIGQRAAPRVGKVTLRSMFPNREEWRRIWAPAGRGSVVGSAIGALPGIGPTLSAFMAYLLEKKVSRTPERFGQGQLEGVTAPEAANNAAVQSGFIPTLSLGIPGDAVMALLLGAMMIHGIVPGPLFMTEYPEMFWGLIMSFWIGNILLLVLNIPLNGLWVRILAIPYHVLYPAILVFICIGVYSARNNVFDIYVALFFGVLGYLMNRLRYPSAPLLLGFVLGPLLEEHFRRSMLLSRGEFGVFLDRPISATFLAATALMLLYAVYLLLRQWRARQ
ncbi:tripartite tricarboxylate transporter permease [Alcanivorax sp. JB21]|uniref:tripartite tricarboxylate transporter permease n=1 Tax=Alcanivorax limicola TaxID=2874102 RepID=UPI001CC17B9E|nr:tripartite tricarboxylate transporter permease [Alcanivorax limicola]MBZ2187539.1 tripartite tricarboxylate transporter permease [Alcanivorax limicola]